EQDYQGLLHGEAVAVGMVLAADLSCRLGHLPAAEVDALRDLLRAAGLPVDVPLGMTTAAFDTHMAVDKKVADGVVRLVLLRRVGEAYISTDHDPRQVAALLADHCKH